jgi:CDP-diglyceride synthetase
MTWQRVATAVVLVPLVVGLVLWGSTAIVSMAIALVTLLALFEYFALGEAIGHRAYRFWTGACALVLVFAQWRASSEPSYYLPGGLVAHEGGRWFASGAPTLDAVFFLFVLGVAALTVGTRRPLVEALPADGPTVSDLRDLRRGLYGLYAVLRLHFAQEDESYLSLFESEVGRVRAGQEVRP